MFNKCLLLLATLTCCAAPAYSAELRVLVAVNFTAPQNDIAAAFERSSGHKVNTSFGSTGALYAQIKNGAPADAFLSADDEAPRRAEQEGLAVAGSRFVYARGRLVLWSAQAGLVDAEGRILASPGTSKIAVTDPKLAPYGVAAFEVMQARGLLDTLRPRLVLGTNLAQTYQFIASGAAPIGFIGLAQVYKDGKINAGSGWMVPTNLHAPILQSAVLLEKGKNNPAALAYLRFLKSADAEKILRAYGYGLPSE